MKVTLASLMVFALAMIVSQASPFGQLSKKDHGKDIPVVLNFPASSYSGNTYTDLFSKDDIYVFKTKMNEGVNWFVDNCYLIYKGQLLDNDKTAEDYGIKSQDMIDRIVWESNEKGNKPGVWRLNLRNSEFDHFAANTSITVGTIKKFIEEKYAISSEDLYMITNGHLLTDDEAPVSKYNVQDGGDIGWTRRSKKH